MSELKADELKSILEQHRLWIEGNGGKCVDLRGADLRYADLRGADLEGADLEGVDMDYPCLPWIPVSERLPEPYTRVLACIKSGYMEVDYMYSEPIVDVGIADFNSLDNVTHWMPLPQPPEVQE